MRLRKNARGSKSKLRENRMTGILVNLSGPFSPQPAPAFECCGARCSLYDGLMASVRRIGHIAKLFQKDQGHRSVRRVLPEAADQLQRGDRRSARVQRLADKGLEQR